MTSFEQPYLSVLRHAQIRPKKLYKSLTCHNAAEIVKLYPQGLFLQFIF
ncbi:hypothetical protein LJPFL01_3337 [Lelliottia jeotgali]|nr:hypothetical protein LJPFL01_3337 [Lelliottia jeotgali]